MPAESGAPRRLTWHAGSDVPHAWTPDGRHLLTLTNGALRRLVRVRGPARLVGTPTPGYVIWTYNFKLVNGTGARMPESGFYRLDGVPQENHGEPPDIEVALSPEEWLKGNDPPLDKAIDLLVREFRAGPAHRAATVRER